MKIGIRGEVRCPKCGSGWISTRYVAYQNVAGWHGEALRHECQGCGYVSWEQTLDADKARAKTPPGVT